MFRLRMAHHDECAKSSPAALGAADRLARSQEYAQRKTAELVRQMEVARGKADVHSLVLHWAPMQE